MDSGDVAQVLDRLSGWGIEVWVDGGWGVDALLGEQTRAHDDLDLVIDRSACPAAGGASAPGLRARHRHLTRPALQVRHHLGYEPDADDHHDMRRLADRFGLELPPPYDG